MSKYRNIDDFFEGNNLSAQPNLIPKEQKEELKFYQGCCYKFLIIFIYFLLIPQIICFIFVGVKELLYIILSLSFILFLLYFFNNKKLEINFNYAENMVTIRLINNLNICIKKIKISFRNIYFKFIINDFHEYIGNLYISNKYKELEEISLDETTIKKKPAIIYYTFENIKLQKLSFTIGQELNSLAYQNRETCPMYTDIEYEITGKVNNDMKYDKFSPYYKMNNYFYCYNIKDDPYTKYYFNTFIIYFSLSTFAFMISIALNPILILILYVLSNAIIITIYIVKRERIFRVDIIFSKNDGKLFIGLVKKGGRSYLKTYTYDTKLIIKFKLSQFENDKNRFALKLIDNQNEEKFIYNFYGTKTELEGLAYILNKY